MTLLVLTPLLFGPSFLSGMLGRAHPGDRVMATGIPASGRVIQQRHAAQAVFPLDAVSAAGTRTWVTGTLWDGVVKATPGDDTDGPNPIEALPSALAACLVVTLGVPDVTITRTMARAADPRVVLAVTGGPKEALHAD